MFSFCVPGHEFEDKSYFTEAAFTGAEIRYEGEKTVNSVQRVAQNPWPIFFVSLLFVVEELQRELNTLRDVD